MRVTFLSMRLEFSTGYHIDALRWDQQSERAIGPNRDGQSADEINGGIMRLARNVRDAAKMFEEMEKVPFNQPVRIINYQGCQRIDEIKPKYEVIGTHTGRRSFICNAISMGIPPQVVMKWTGHSDYKAMKPYIDVCDEIKAEAMKKFDDP